MLKKLVPLGSRHREERSDMAISASINSIAQPEIATLPAVARNDVVQGLSTGSNVWGGDAGRDQGASNCEELDLPFMALHSSS
jgi:hypothetical protein